MILERIKDISNGRIITTDSDFIETEHPRDNDGKFAEKSSSSDHKVKAKVHGNKSIIEEYGIKSDSFNDLANFEGVEEVEIDVKATIDGTISCATVFYKEGKPFGEADFDIEDYSMDIDHVSFETQEHQAKGYCTAFLENTKKLCKKFGIEEINLFADITIGKYAWAKMGFDFADEGYVLDVKRELKKYANKIIEKKGLSLSSEQTKKINFMIRSIKSAKDIADLKIPGLEATAAELNTMIGFENDDVDKSLRMDIGKAFMLDDYGLEGWNGVLRV